MKTKTKKYTNTKAADVPVTQRMLFAVRDELKSDLKALEARTFGKMGSLEGKMDSHFHELSSKLHQMQILFEEQNARNIFVMDGLSSLFDRQERLEVKIAKRFAP